MSRIWNFLTNYSLLLIIGALIALVWANIDDDSYLHFVEFEIWDHAPIGHPHDGHRTLTLHYLVNDLLMALFFAIAAKEVWAAVILKNGSLRGKKAATPFFATLGGMLGPISVYLGLALLFGSDTFSAVAIGWVILTATYPVWLLCSLAASVGVFVLANWLPCRMDQGNPACTASTWIHERLHFLPYFVAGCASWYGFMRSGLHLALGVLPARCFGSKSAPINGLIRAHKAEQSRQKSSVRAALLCNANKLWFI